jgi:hypothetical protein
MLLKDDFGTHRCFTAHIQSECFTYLFVIYLTTLSIVLATDYSTDQIFLENPHFLHMRKQIPIAYDKKTIQILGEK